MPMSLAWLVVSQTGKWAGGDVKLSANEGEPIGGVFWATFSRRDHRAVHAPVSALSSQLSQSSGDDGGARTEAGSFDRCPLGAAVCTSAERADSTGNAVAEMYVRVAGTWTYLYRAIDAAGNTI